MLNTLRAARFNILLFCQSTDKKVLFGYWSSFIPDNTVSSSWSLFNIILKDPTPKVGESCFIVTG